MQQKNRRPLRYLSAGAAGLFVLWFAVSLQLFCLVSTPAPPPVDAIVVLGGSSGERLPAAQALETAQAGRGAAPVLVLSWTDTPGNASIDALCNTASFPQQSLICFRPEGMDTRGEAAAVGKLAKENGWQSVAVVTSSYHALRAGTLMRQCTSADVHMVASEPALDSLQWLRRFVIEEAGLVDAILRPECR
ncbi:YdcF family protein [Arthrobacter celericrescens]|uniref:YdcF family protein n=1 Tax=Arthrobacter celericrescens TaxID=2320851 RepID=UPI000EA3496E|nr:YdcF family protein [Arthrobacter celericrescens]